MYKGVGASEGIAIGRAFVLPSWEWDMTQSEIDVSDLAHEFERLYAGIRTSKLEIKNMQKEISDVIGEQESSIFDAHLAILDDPVFMREVQGIISRQYKAAEVAVKEAIDKFAEMFDLLDDEYMKERALDIKDVGNRLLKHLLGTPEITLPVNTAPFILVARELSPSQLAHLNPSHVLGLVSLVGGQTSHSAIMARAMGIPFVVGIEGASDEQAIATGDLLIVDGHDGIVVVNPDEATLDTYTERHKQWVAEKQQLSKLIDVPAETQDNIQMTLSMNISSLKDLETGLSYGASGVGLFRTEFMFLERDTAPSEEEQFAVYKQALAMLDGKPLTIRTLDIGGDKQVNYMFMREEENPFLGYRGIRVCLDQPHLFKTQLRAIMRASHYGKVRIVYPLVSSLDELRKANALLAEAKEELAQLNIPFDENIEIGLIIELPATAMIAHLLAEDVDFFSIGTNDLIQYTLAVDRMNEFISHLYDPFHPAVLRLIHIIVEAAKQANIEVSICGEMASDPVALPLWLGMHVHHLSMSGQSLLKIKEVVLRSQAAACEAILPHVLALPTGEQVHDYLHRFYKQYR